jgi:hypothetical protein
VVLPPGGGVATLIQAICQTFIHSVSNHAAGKGFFMAAAKQKEKTS